MPDDDPDIRLSPAGTAVQQFTALNGDRRWLYLVPADDTLDLRLQLCTDGEVADWPRLRVVR